MEVEFLKEHKTDSRTFRKGYKCIALDEKAKEWIEQGIAKQVTGFALEEQEMVNSFLQSKEEQTHIHIHLNQEEE